MGPDSCPESGPVPRPAEAPFARKNEGEPVFWAAKWGPKTGLDSRPIFSEILRNGAQLVGPHNPWRHSGPACVERLASASDMPQGKPTDTAAGRCAGWACSPQMAP